jgi:hypothetical protein
MTQIQTTETTNAVETAQNRIEAIRTALASGDEKIRAADLMTARNELEFQLLRQQAAEISKQKAAEAQRLSFLLGLEKQLAAVSESRSGVDKKFAAFEKSLGDYLSTCSNYQNELNEIRSSLQTAGLYPGETLGLVGGIAPPDVVPGVKVTDVRRTLTINAASASNVLPDDVVKPVIERALGEYSRHF